MQLKREWVDALLHDYDLKHGGLSRQEDEIISRDRFTQASPILPDVWKAFGELGTRSGKRIDLLLTPQWGYRPGQISKTLVERLGTEEALKAELAYNQTTAVVCVTFDQLIGDLLPLTGWWVRNIEALASVPDDSPTKQPESVPDYRHIVDRLQDAIAQMRNKRQETPIPTERSAGAAPPELLWLAQCIGAFLRGVESTVKKPTNSTWRHIMNDTAGNYTRAAIWFGTVRHQPPPVLPGRTEEETRTGPIYSITRNRPASVTIAFSTRTVKADAVARLFRISCQDITWAVVDAGIDATHTAFRALQPDGKTYPNPFEKITRVTGKPYIVNRTRVAATFDFTQIRRLLSVAAVGVEGLPAEMRSRIEADGLAETVANIQSALASGRELDWGQLRSLLEVPLGPDYQPPYQKHGTHVAGILGASEHPSVIATTPGANGENFTLRQGVCPDIQLYDLRVLRGEPDDNEFAVISALQFVRFLNAHQDRAVIHGVNLSLSLKHDVRNYACGHTPVCEECERLVGAGVTVVTAAGNQGWREIRSSNGVFDGYQPSSITDPGNADGVITVGSTHRCEPHNYGISFFSSRGPTGDGRSKPDLVAPGEKIEAPVPNEGWEVLDGTSMATPHVSGAAALLMARNNELIGHPVRIKKLLCTTATDLGRERSFQGAGLLDILRALQAV